MGQTQSIQKISFEDVQYIIKKGEVCLLINTLNEKEQECLIKGTIYYSNEETIINNVLKKGDKQIKVIVYGKNNNDEKIYQKYNQLYSLGFYNIYLYTGGLFEWLLLQDIYGETEFPTSSKQLDILKYKPNKIFDVPLLEY